MERSQQSRVGKSSSVPSANEADDEPQDEVREEISSGRIGGVVLALILIVWFASNFV